VSRLGPTPYPPAWADTEPTSRPPTSRSPASIVVVAATRVRLSRLMALIESAPFEVHGIARSVDGAVLLVTESQPAAVLLDLGAASGGLDLVERLMARVPTPIVITGAAAASASEALALGAVAVVGDETEMLGAGPYAAELISHLTVATRVRVITHPRGRLRDQARSIPTPVDVPSLSGGPTVAAVPAVPSMTAGPADDAVAIPASRAPRRRPSVVAIGASTGGPAALVKVLRGLPADFASPVVVVQHMADGFIDGLARWLDELVPLEVVVARDGDRLRPGVVMLASSEGNLAVEASQRVRIRPRRPGQFHVPEVDTTFRCIAESCRERAVGVLLTGMGRDGADGLRRMRIAGAHTIAQDEPTSAVWGMPGAAAAMDAVDEELPIDRIAEAVINAVTSRESDVDATPAQAGGAA